MCNDRSHEQLIQVLHGVLQELKEKDEVLKEVQKLKQVQAFIIKKAVEEDRAICAANKSKRCKGNKCL